MVVFKFTLLWWMWKIYIEFVDKKCSNHQSHRQYLHIFFVTMIFETFSNRELGCPSCCRLIERKLKT